MAVEKSMMHDPAHPGEILRMMYMEPLKISATKLARDIGIDRKTISRLINGQSPVTLHVAFRLGKAFNNSPQFWLNMQQAYDVWHQQKELAPVIEAIEPYQFDKLPL